LIIIGFTLDCSLQSEKSFIRSTIMINEINKQENNAQNLKPLASEPTSNVAPEHEPTSYTTQAPLTEESPKQPVMYSPGICVNQPGPSPYANYYAPPPPPPKQKQKRKGGVGGFIRAACLVLVCTLASAAATYVVMDFRYDRGDFAQQPQVILGSDRDSQTQDNSYIAPLVIPGDEMDAQDIYDMARSQVVAVNTHMPISYDGAGTDNDRISVTGSGFIISTDGYILTNYHVIETAHVNRFTINVVLSDGTSYDATIIGFEASNDVAVLKIDATDLNPAMIGNSFDIRVGQRVYAVGNPFGDLVYTMTDGIVSALDRVVSVEGITISMFQFSAAVNSGNSGGPIYNSRGEVIGIVTAKEIRRNVEGIGFAIPINDAIDIAKALIEHGYITGRPLLGITVQTVSRANAEFYNWVVGTYVRSVFEGSAADKAGIQAGDIITKIADVDVESLELLRFALQNHNAGDTTIITVWRDGDYVELTITFDEDLHAGQPNRPTIPEPDTPDPFADTP
jgi:serine protease Do